MSVGSALSHKSSHLDSLLHRLVPLIIYEFFVDICLICFKHILPLYLFLQFLLDFFLFKFWIFLLAFSLSLPSFYFFVFHPSLPSFPTSSSSTPFLPILSTSPEPSAPPQDIKCSSTSSTTLLVSWHPPPLESQNGVLSGYRVRYQLVGPSEVGSDDGEPTEEPTVPATDEQVLLQRLEKWTQYHITVTAFTVIGPGPESEPLICRTDEDGT